MLADLKKEICLQVNKKPKLLHLGKKEPCKKTPTEGDVKNLQNLHTVASKILKKRGKLEKEM